MGNKIADVELRAAADRAARGRLDAMAKLSATQPEGYLYAAERGTVEFVTGVPFSSANGVAVLTRDPDPAEVAALASSPRFGAVAWSIQVRGEEVDDTVVRTAARHGLTERVTVPVMVKTLTAADAADVPAARRITGVSSALYQRALAEGFEAPEPLFARLAAPLVLDHTAMAAYVIDVKGEAVATSFGILSGDVVGVYNVSVSPAHRGRGHGRAVTRAVLRDAYARGARSAYLHATGGLPLYRGLGFRLAEHWSIFTAKP